MFRVLHALNVVLDASPVQRPPGRVDLDELLGAGQPDREETDRD